MKFTHAENYIKKPSSYARESYDEHSYEARTAPGTSSEYNNPNISLNNLFKCYDMECNSTDLEYDFKRDQLSCRTCGLVLKENIHDYKELIRSTTPTEVLGTATFSQHRNENYLLELIEIQEYKKKLNLVDY